MGKVEDALRDFIQYHSRREARNVFDDTPDRVKELKRDLRDLRRTVEDLEEKVDVLLEAHHARMDIPPAGEEETEEARVTSRTISSIRDRFDLTQDQLADLLDVSSGTITSWENGDTRPRDNNKARIITLREMEKDEVDEILGREEDTIPFDPEELRDFREEKNLTREQLGVLLDVSGSSIYNWERGETEPGSETIETFRELRELDEDRVYTKLAKETGMYSGENLTELREERELSQKELAEKLDVSPGTVSNWEREINSPGRKAIQKFRELEKS